MKEILAVVKLLCFVIIVTLFILWSYVCHWIVWNEDRRLEVFSKNVTSATKLLLKIFNLKLKLINPPPADEHCLLVANHMGFVDILMLSSIYPVVFVTSVEMRETPFLGLLAEMGGCIYVERRSRLNILNELGNIADCLKKGFRVCIYPEAKATNGEQVLPFKKTLLMAAAKAGVPIQPAVVNFRKINGEDFSLKWRDHVCWYGTIPFVTSLWKSATLLSVEADVEFLKLVPTSENDDRTELAENLHRMISDKYNPPK